MPLPSKYSREGLSFADQHKTITTGNSAHKSSIQHRVVHSADEMQLESRFNEPKEFSPTLQELGEEEAWRYRPLYNPNNTPPPGPVLQARLAQIGGNVSFLVLDTNFILSHLSLLNELKEYGAKCKFILVIPLEVVRELDGLKSSEKPSLSDSASLTTVGKLARMANDWIYYCLAELCPTVYAQRRNEVIEDFLSNDDAILDCSLYFKGAFPNTLHVILSNDKNLCMKALLSDILTISHRPGMEAKVIAKRVFSESANRFHGSIEQVPIDLQMKSHPDQTQPAESIHDSIVDLTIIEEPAGELMVVEEPNNSDLLVPLSDSTSIQVQTFMDIINTVYSEIEKILVSLLKHRVRPRGDDTDVYMDDDDHNIVNLQDAAIAFDGLTFQRYGTPKTFRFRIGELHDFCLKVPQNIQELEFFVKFWCKQLLRLYEWSMPPEQTNALEHLIKRWRALVDEAKRLAVS